MKGLYLWNGICGVVDMKGSRSKWWGRGVGPGKEKAPGRGRANAGMCASALHEEEESAVAVRSHGPHCKRHRSPIQRSSMVMKVLLRLLLLVFTSANIY